MGGGDDRRQSESMNIEGMVDGPKDSMGGGDDRRQSESMTIEGMV